MAGFEGSHSFLREGQASMNVKHKIDTRSWLTHNVSGKRDTCGSIFIVFLSLFLYVLLFNRSPRWFSW